MHDTPRDPADLVRPLTRVRQIREYTSEPVTPTELAAIADAARWSGSSSNEQPWRFITITDPETIRRLADASMPSSRSLRTASAAIAIVIAEEAGRAVSHAYDEGRAAERILIAASILGLGAGISWTSSDVRPAVKELLGVSGAWTVRTIVALGHPTEAARKPRSAPGTARRPREEAVFSERWPARP
jgi:nitroreductase